MEWAYTEITQEKAGILLKKRVEKISNTFAVSRRSFKEELLNGNYIKADHPADSIVNTFFIAHEDVANSSGKCLNNIQKHGRNGKKANGDSVKIEEQ